MSAKKRTTALTVVTVVVMSAFATTGDIKAAADPSPEEAQALVEGRQSHMREHAVAFYNLANYLKAGEPHSPAALNDAREFLANTQEMKSWFRPGTGPSPSLATAARPEIWQRPEEFKRYREALAREAQKLVDAVQAEDLTKAKQQYNATGEVCNACHAQFRAEQRIEKFP